jgi:hypothetical protein
MQRFDERQLFPSGGAKKESRSAPGLFRIIGERCQFPIEKIRSKTMPLVGRTSGMDPSLFWEAA